MPASPPKAQELLQVAQRPSRGLSRSLRGCRQPHEGFGDLGKPWKISRLPQGTPVLRKVPWFLARCLGSSQGTRAPCKDPKNPKGLEGFEQFADEVGTSQSSCSNRSRATVPNRTLEKFILKLDRIQLTKPHHVSELHKQLRVVSQKNKNRSQKSKNKRVPPKPRARKETLVAFSPADNPSPESESEDEETSEVYEEPTVTHPPPRKRRRH